MSIDIDGSPRRPVRRPPLRYVAVAAILAATLAAVVLVQRPDDGTARPDNLAGQPVDAPPVDLAGQIGQRMVTVLEQLPPTAHHGHGDHLGQSGAQQSTVVCAVRVFGFEPTGATRLGDVQIVYGHHFCSIAERNRPWNYATKLVGPLVMHLSASPPTVQIAASSEGVSFQERVRQLMPEQYWQQAYEETLGPGSMQRLRERYDAAAGL